MEPLIFFTTLWILWLIGSRRWRRLVIRPLAIMGVVYLGLTSSVMLDLASQGLTSNLPQDSGEKADAIIILGRGQPFRSTRVELATKLWQDKRAPMIFVSGMLDAEEIISQLQNKGIPKPKLSGERCSQNTEENAQFTKAVLQSKGVRKILLVTDFPHMPRSQILFQSFGFKVIPHPIALPTQWNTTDQLGIVLREYLGLTVYRWQGRLRDRTQAEQDHPSELVSDRLKTWNCLVN